MQMDDVRLHRSNKRCELLRSPSVPKRLKRKRAIREQCIIASERLNTFAASAQ